MIARKSRRLAADSRKDQTKMIMMIMTNYRRVSHSWMRSVLTAFPLYAAMCLFRRTICLPHLKWFTFFYLLFFEAVWLMCCSTGIIYVEPHWAVISSCDRTRNAIYASACYTLASHPTSESKWIMRWIIDSRIGYSLLVFGVFIHSMTRSLMIGIIESAAYGFE